MKKILFLIFVSVSCATAAWALLAFSTPTATEHLVISGTIDTTQTLLAFQREGRIASLLVDEGDRVNKGQLLATLDDVTANAEVAMQRAQLDAALAALNDLSAGYRPEEIAALEAAVAEARVTLAQRHRDLERQRRLLTREIIAPHDLELAETAHGQAAAALARCQAQLNEAYAGFRAQQIERAAALASAQASLVAQTEERHRWTHLYAPADGTVLTKYAELGEVLRAGQPAVSVADLRDVWLRAYVPETSLGRVHLQQKVNVRTDSYPDKLYSGTIRFISAHAEFTPKQVQTEDDRTALVYRVKIALDNSHDEFKLGMPADAIIY